MKDSFRSSVTVYTERRKKKSIWLRSCGMLALIVVLLTSYVLIFPARTVEQELICALEEHVHDESCYSAVLACGQEEGEDHTHTDACWTSVLVCTKTEHTHQPECYSELPPAEELTLAPETEPTEVPTTAAPTEPAAPIETETPIPAGTEAPIPAETGAAEAPVPETGEAPLPTEPVQTPEETTAPVVTEPAREDSEMVVAQPFRTAEPVQYVYPEEGIDLAEYLYSVVFQREENGIYVADTWFENGESVKASIVYDIPKDVVTADNRHVYYNLPEGIVPIEETSGEVMDDGVPVGVYTITTEGVIHILFNEDFANGNAIMGTVEFTSWLWANEDDTDREVEFDNDAGKITIVVPDSQKYDLSLEKTGTFNHDYSKAEYVLTVHSEKGTGAAVQITDELFNQTPATLFTVGYDRGSVAVYRYDAEGNETLITDYLIDWRDDGTKFAIDALPALEAGERYEIRYSVDLSADLSASFSLDNEATAKAGELEGTVNAYLNYVSDITKTGAFNRETGLIDWVITVNPEGRPVAGWQILDELPYPAVGRVLLTNANGVRVADITPDDGRTINYTFPPNALPRLYYIRYSTAAPATNATVHNEVRLINDRDTVVEYDVDVSERAEGVEKKVGAKRLWSDGQVRTNWSFVITLPIGELDRYDFRDIVSNAVVDAREGDSYPASLQYAYAAELEEAFRGSLRLIDGGNTYYYGDENNDYVDFLITYQDAQRNTVEPTDTTTHVARVLFSVVPKNGNTFHGYQIVMDDYPTWLDASSAREGDSWIYENQIFLQGGERAVASSSYLRGNVFDKQFLGTNGRYTSSDYTLDYDDTDGTLTYRLLMNLVSVTGDSLTVTDVLPAGMELVEDSVKPFYTGATANSEYDGTFTDPENFSVQTAPGENGTTVVTFTARDITDLMKQTYTYVGITYKVRLTDAELWNDYTNGSKTFTNNASWMDYTDSHSVTVENHAKRLEKTGAQLLDSEGTYLGRIRFTVLINAAAEDLDPASDELVLTDQFQSDIAAALEMSSVTLYHYDPKRPGNLGNRVQPYEYSLHYDDETDTMTIRLKDETAYLLVYDYSVDYGEILDDRTSVSNQASLNGEFFSSTSVTLHGVSSSATAWQRVIVITKVDQDNNAKVLPGAEFLLEYWDPELETWSLMLGEDGQPRTFVTNEAGKIVLSLIGSDRDLEASTLYRLTETKAAPGYDMADTVLWFLCMPRNGGNREEVFAQAGANSGVSMEDVYFFSPTGGTCVITNPFRGLSVNKRWFTADGVEMNDPLQDPVTVTLYVSKDPTGGEKTPVAADALVENPVLLSQDNDWTYTWDRLPHSDEDGDPLYYFVEEDEVTGFRAEYINNGVNSGTIVITNRAVPIPLPETGGSGIDGWLFAGCLLIALSILNVLVTARRRIRSR